MKHLNDRPHLHSPMQPRQRGVALVIGMVFLVMLSLAGLIAMNRTILQERMTGAYRSEQMAFAAAEGGLRRAEWNLWIYPVQNNLAFPKRTIPESDGDCSDVCASDAAYADGAETRKQRFMRQQPAEAILSETDGGGISANRHFSNASVTGSQSAYPPLALIEYINDGGIYESFPVGQSGIKGVLRTYRINARGFGPTGDIERQLQSTYTLIE